ncbi:MAG: hypothetical protein R2737_04975 [Candidatus Nanopelagicales bacterium]
MSPLRLSLRTIAVVQAFFGVLFLVAPAAAPNLLGLTEQQPGWVNWLFAMMAARFLGYAVGLWLAAGNPQRHLSWINTMIGIQALDWLATLAFLASGELALRNVTTAAVLPPLFIAALIWWHPRRTGDRTRVASTADA